MNTNLAEQLRAHAQWCRAYAPESQSHKPDLYEQAADTIESQSRLIDLAETLAGAVNSIESAMSDTQKPVGLLHDAIDCAEDFTTAQAEYQTTGTVPCGECEARDAEYQEIVSAGQELEMERGKLRAKLDQVEVERDDLRRQVQEREEKYREQVGATSDLIRQADDLRRQLAEAQGKVRAADRLADEVAIMVRRGILGSRTPAADALLDYREPPSTERADRMAELDRQLAEAQQLHSDVRALIVQYKDERDQAQSDNTALKAEIERMKADGNR